MAQLLDFISAHKETIACFPLSVFAHMAATIRELLGPEASIVHEIVTKEMGADSAELVVAECRIDGAQHIKRFRPKDRGRAHPILKRTSHITVGLQERAGAGA